MGYGKGGSGVPIFPRPIFGCFSPTPSPRYHRFFFRFKLQKPEVCAGFFYSYHNIGAERGSAGSAD